MTRISTIFATILIAITALGQTAALQQVRFHNEAQDTARITAILVDAEKQHLKTPSEIAAYIAPKFIGTPYVAHTLEGDPELVTVNIDELDCTTFVETVAALALTVDERRASWRDFVYNLERIRYRSGKLNGYPSRLHYNSDWAVDNIYRGNIKDITILYPQYSSASKTLDFMTENADKYPALADSANLARMKDVELGYRLHKVPYIKTSLLDKKEIKEDLRSGDIVALITKTKNLDATHMGFIMFKDGEPYLLHASSVSGKVEMSATPLAEYMRRNHSLLGVRIFRLQ